MRFQRFGPLNTNVPVIGQGSWELPERGNAVETAKQALRAGIELGMVHVDTAEMYGNGKAETIIAEAIKGFPRDRLFIVSKVLPSNASYAGTIKSCEVSLKRLQLDYLDCYLLHWRGHHPLSDTMAALEKLVSDGKIRSLGVSNFDIADLQEAESCLAKEALSCNQVLYNLHARGIERKLIGYCRQRNIAVVGYTPFAQRKPPAPASRAGQVLASIAEKHSATVRQVILAFLVRLDGLFTIPKAAKVEHVKENAAAGDLLLDESDIQDIDAVYPAPTSDVPLGMV
ncbi:MAG TPA: aldo/keto reductase [Candidatus Obscuribacterales bacterium]